MSHHRSSVRAALGRRRLACLLAGALLAPAAVAPAAHAWNGDIEVRKVNVGGPAADTFSFRVDARRYGQPWATLPATDYDGASWNGKPKPDNPFALAGAPGPDGPFTRSGPAPTAARFTTIDAAGEVAVPAPAVRDWRGVRVTETATPPGYRTSAACTVANSASGAGWTSGLDQDWGAWSATPTTAGGGPGVETTLRWLPDTVAAGARGPWIVTCTFTNTYRARVKVLKRFVTPITTAPRVDITVNGADVDTAAGAETFADGDASDWIAVDGGSSVALAETAGPGTVLTDYDAKLECRSGTGGVYGDWVAIATGPAGTLASTQPGRDYECRFTNTGRVPQGGVGNGPPTTGGTPPKGPVTPSVPPVGRPASARVSGSSGCIRRAHVIADVRGRRIARVTFSVNGRTVKRLDSANVAGMFRLRVPAASLPRGASRVTADVAFEAGAQTAPRRLSLAFSRCPRRAGGPPPFTG